MLPKGHTVPAFPDILTPCATICHELLGNSMLTHFKNRGAVPQDRCGAGEYLHQHERDHSVAYTCPPTLRFAPGTLRSGGARGALPHGDMELDFEKTLA